MIKQMWDSILSVLKITFHIHWWKYGTTTRTYTHHKCKRTIEFRSRECKCGKRQLYTQRPCINGVCDDEWVNY